jgi:hypothetical protein
MYLYAYEADGSSAYVYVYGEIASFFYVHWASMYMNVHIAQNWKC